MSSGPTTPAPQTLPPIRSPTANLGTLLGVTAIALAVIAIALNFVVPGPTGPAGTAASGSNSPTGAPPVTYWAFVASDGGFSRGDGTYDSLQAPGIGHYDVDFNETLWDCTEWAVLGTPGAVTTVPGSATVAPAAAGSDVLVVTTFNATGVATNESFQLFASCPGGYWAVVAANGTLLSGSGVSSSENWLHDHGEYQVIFNRGVAQCSYSVGLGSSFTGSPPSGSASAAPRLADAFGVWVQTFNSVGVGTNSTFHLAVYC